MAENSFWKRCSSCRKEIGFATIYWVCSVSTCTRKRTGMVFCSVSCWEMHLPMMRHREAYAVEERSPSRAAWEAENRESVAPTGTPASTSASTPGAGTVATPSATPGEAVRRRVVAPAPAAVESVPSATQAAEDGDDDLPYEILVVASKLKNYIRARSGMNTSDTVLPVLSDHLRALCRVAIRNAAQDGRRTVLDRDIPKV